MQSFDVRVGEIVRYAITERVFPGAVLAVLKNGNFAYEQCFGHFTYDQESPDVLKNTVYDIASLTKQIVATGALILFDRGDIHLEDTINLFLPELAGSSIGNVTIFNLLTHTSGINIQTSKFRVDELGSLLSGILPQLDVHDSGQVVQYANINTYLLGEIVSRISGLSLSDFLSQEIFVPLGMSSTFFAPKKNIQSAIPPTEILHDGTLIQGIVHDESARMMGGMVGQAGIFSNVIDLGSFINSWLGVAKQILKSRTIELATKNQTTGLNKACGLGWHLDNSDYLGADFQLGTFFHPGFTGAIMGGNKKNSLGFVFLSNCTYPNREGNIKKNMLFQKLLKEVFQEFYA